MLSGLVTAFRTLTILPVPGRNAEKLSSALPWFPLVGVLPGLLLYVPAVLLRLMPLWTVQPALIAAIVLAGNCFLTRGLHLDGLADFADGFGGGRDKEKTLSIMKDPRVGAFGVIALIVVLIGKWSAYFALARCNSLSWIIAALAVSRAVQVHLAVSLPYARAEGGTAGPFVDGATGTHRALAWGLAALLCIAFCGPVGAVLIVPALLAALLLGFWFRARVGGVTGDLLGAASELTETGLLVLVALGGRFLAAFTGWVWLVKALYCAVRAAAG